MQPSTDTDEIPEDTFNTLAKRWLILNKQEPAMTNTDVMNRVYEVLELACFFETSPNIFQLASNCPKWILNFCPELADQKSVNLGKRFIFLDTFIDQSRELFQSGESKRLSFGPWSERDLDDEEQHLSATAINLGDCLAIQLRQISKDKLNHRRILQKSREYGLNYEWLQRQKEQRDTLVSAIEHDLAGPLTALSEIVELLAHTDNDRLEQRQLLTKAKSHIDDTHKIARSILEVFNTKEQKIAESRVTEEGVSPIFFTLVSVVDEFDPVFRQQGVILKLNCNLVDTAQRIIGENESHPRVLVNLLDNALRYSPSKSEVTIALDDNETEVIISITDQGQGVDEELVETLFQRAGSDKPYDRESGFGLYFCRMWVSKWGGKLRYLQAKDRQVDDSQGACFEITLKKLK